MFSSSSSLLSWYFHLHPSDDVLVDDLPELELRRHIVVDVVDDPHLVSNYFHSLVEQSVKYDNIVDVMDSFKFIGNL